MIRGLLLCLVSALLLVCAGCPGGTGSSLPNPTVMFFNASADSPDIDFYLDKDLAAAALGFLANSTFTAIEPAERDVSANEAGTTNQYDVIFYDFTRNSHNLMATIGLVNYGSELQKRIRLISHTVDRRRPNGTKARLVIIHAFNRAPGFQTPSIDFQTPGQNPIYAARDIGYGEATPLLIDSGTFTFEARRFNTEHVFVTLNNFTFQSEKIYLVFVVGVEDAAGPQAPQIFVLEIPST